MTFNSLFNLIETDTDGVYKFICRIFYETNSELCIEDRLYLFAMIKKFKVEPEKDDSHFKSLFENKKGLLKVINLITGDSEFSFFTNGKDVEFSQLSGDALNLSYVYAEIFGVSNIKNPADVYCKKVNANVVSC